MTTPQTRLIQDPSRRRVMAAIGSATFAFAVGLKAQSKALAQSRTAPPDTLKQVKALGFDVFGTVVDWRGTLIREAEPISRERGIQINWGAFADAWRAEYGPSMAPIREGTRPWVNLDVLHRENLLKVVDRFGITGLREQDLNTLVGIWHRLDAWPDAVEGLTRLKRRYIIVTLSNGNVAMMLDIAKHAGLPWDSVMGAELAHQYKPNPEAYLTTVRMMGLTPPEVMMVAAHNRDLAGARNAGLRTGYVIRPTMDGPKQTRDLAPDSDWDVVARDFPDLADQLGA